MTNRPERNIEHKDGMYRASVDRAFYRNGGRSHKKVLGNWHDNIIKARADRAEIESRAWRKKRNSKEHIVSVGLNGDELVFVLDWAATLKCGRGPAIRDIVQRAMKEWS